MLLQPLRRRCVKCMIHHERMCMKNNTHIYVAWTSNNKVIMACHFYWYLLPQCEALRTCHSGFPIATKCNALIQSIHTCPYSWATGCNTSLLLNFCHLFPPFLFSLQTHLRMLCAHQWDIHATVVLQYHYGPLVIMLLFLIFKFCVDKHCFSPLLCAFVL